MRFPFDAFLALLEQEQAWKGFSSSAWNALHYLVEPASKTHPDPLPPDKEGAAELAKAGLLSRIEGPRPRWEPKPLLRRLFPALQAVSHFTFPDEPYLHRALYAHYMFHPTELMALAGIPDGPTPLDAPAPRHRWHPSHPPLQRFAAASAHCLLDPSHARRILDSPFPPGATEEPPLDRQAWNAARQLILDLLAAPQARFRSLAGLARQFGEPDTSCSPQLAAMLFLGLQSGLLRIARLQPFLVFYVDPVLHRRWQILALHGDAGPPPRGLLAAEAQGAGEGAGDGDAEGRKRHAQEPRTIALAIDGPIAKSSDGSFDPDRRPVVLFQRAFNYFFDSSPVWPSWALALPIVTKRGPSLVASPPTSLTEAAARRSWPPAVEVLPLPLEKGRSEAYLIWELEMFLRGASHGEWLMLRSGKALYASSQRTLDDKLAAHDGALLPPQTRSVATRRGHLLHLARTLGFVDLDPPPGPLALHLTATGRNWLQSSPPVRLRSLISSMFGTLFRLPAAPRSPGSPGAAFISLWEDNSAFLTDANAHLVGPALRACFEVLRHGGFARPEEIAWHQAHLCPPGAVPRVGFGTTDPERFPEFWTNADLVEAWAALIEHLIAHGLSPLGGIAWAADEAGRPLMALTPVGRFILGFQDDLTVREVATLAPAAAELGQPLLVQPSFEIVFRRPDPRLEAELSVFAERVGHRTGTVFRLTRKGVMAALAKGYTLHTLWRLLEAQVAAPIPANVRTEVEAWARNVVRMEAHSAILLQVPDEATLQRLLDVGRNKVIRLGDLLVQLCGTPRELRQLVDRLQAAGLFVTLPELPATPTRRGRPPYRPR